MTIKCTICSRLAGDKDKTCSGCGAKISRGANEGQYSRLTSLGAMIGCVIITAIYFNTDYIQEPEILKYMMSASVSGVLLGGAFAYFFWRGRVEFVATEDKTSAKKGDAGR
jgi:hypothetical protein